MRGYKEFNFPAFDHATFLLRSEGNTVWSPAERDRDRFGDDIQYVAVKEAQRRGFTIRAVLADDLKWLCCNADMIALLPGWRKSLGARAEKAAADAIGIPHKFLGKVYVL